MASHSLITFTSDFGLRDPYVAAVKGAILSVDPVRRIVDVSHEVRPHDILEGAFQLLCCYPYFPPGTVHLVVVDPGVGSDRRAIAVRAVGQYFVAPDNGVLSLVLEQVSVQQIVSLEEERFFRKPVSNTFHGRDIFGPAAAWIAKGTELTDLGPLVDKPIRLDLPPMKARQESGLRGFVLHIDRFGNIITSLRPEDLAQKDATVSFVLGDRPVLQQVELYADPTAEELFFLVGSSGFFEVAARGQSAAQILEIDVKDEVTLLEA